MKSQKNKQQLIRIRKFRTRDTKEVASLVYRTYSNFNSKEYIEKEAVERYKNNYNPQTNSVKALLEHFNRTPLF